MSKFEISGHAAQQILDYLITRPWQEVNGHVALLQNITPIEEPKHASLSEAKAVPNTKAKKA